MQGKVVEARPQALQKRKDSRYAVALDSEQNTIQKKDIVKVIDGPHAVSSFQRSVGMFSNITILYLIQTLLYWFWLKGTNFEHHFLQEKSVL
jgi:hypothetical protein